MILPLASRIPCAGRRRPWASEAVGVADVQPLDLIPVIGSTIGGAIVSLVALTVSLPVAIATLAFYIGYRLFEDYLLTPRIMGGAVKVPAVVSVVAVLVGGALLGIIGALVAIPVAAALRLLLEEVTFRRLDRS